MSKRIDEIGLQVVIELLMKEIDKSKVDIASVVDMTAASVENLGTERNKLTTVEAVYNAVKSANHAGFKFVKSVDGKSFEEMMENISPQELTFYVFKDNDADNIFDLYIYDAQQGKYVKIGETSFEGNNVDLTGYWSKNELDITEYAKTADIPDVSKFITAADINLDNYVTKDENEVMTAAEVVVMFNNIKNGTIPPAVGEGEAEF